MKIIQKPWGHEEVLVKAPFYVVKKLVVKSGHRLSLQYHKIKTESWYILKGTTNIIIGQEPSIGIKGDFIHIPAGTIHRIEAHNNDVTILEVSTPELDDVVVRIEDDYNRI